MELDLNASYDNGYFDKDEQGWCARRVEIRRDGDTVSVRTWGDDNGARAYDDMATYRVGEYLAELGVVRLLNEQARLVSYFDVNRRGLRSVVEQEVARFAAPAGYMSRVGREALGTLLAPVARVLQISAGEPPPMPLGELTPSPTASGAMEALGGTKGAAAEWRWMHRYYPAADSLQVGPHQMAVDIEGVAGPHRSVVSVFVQAPDHANFVVRGWIEVMPQALALREKVIAEWTGMVFPESE